MPVIVSSNRIGDYSTSDGEDPVGPGIARAGIGGWVQIRKVVRSSIIWIFVATLPTGNQHREEIGAVHQGRLVALRAAAQPDVRFIVINGNCSG